LNESKRKGIYFEA